MKTKTTVIISISIIVLEFLIVLLAYSYLPDRIATHWDLYGNVNGYMGKTEGLLFSPIISVGLFVLLMVVPKMDPKAQNIAKFRSTFNMFIVGFMLFMFYVNLLTLVPNLGISINMIQWLMPAMSGLFFLVGVMLEKAEPNYAIGIRTPWTLASEKVWYKTHKLGAKLFKVSAILSLIAVILPEIGFVLFMVSVLGGSLFLVAYSYYLYRKEKYS